MLGRTFARSKSVVNVLRVASISSAMFDLYTPMRSVRLVLLSRVSMSLIYSGFWQLTVARSRGATRSLADTIISANICACIATFRRPRTAHSGLFDWVDRIFASPLTLHSLLTLLFARTLLHAHFHTPNTCPCLYRPAFVSLRIVPCIPSSSPLRLLSPRSPRLAMPDLDVYPTLSYLDLLRPTVLPFSRPACACFQSETWRTRTRAAQVVHPLPMIIITLSFHFARTINISHFLFLLLFCPNIPGPVLFLPGCGSDGLG